MKAVVIREPGGPEVLEVREVPTPEPGYEQVLVRVHAAGLNRADLVQRRGRYPAPPGSPADIPGLEFAGEVAALGPGVVGLKEGQRVYGIAGGGGQAEYTVAHQRMLAPIPANLDWVAAGGVPEVFITVHDALFTQAELRPGETVLIHGVGSGIGTTAVQMARAAGARAIGTSRTPAKLERARAEVGLDVGLLAEGFGKAVLQATDGRGAQVVLDMVGGPYMADNLQAMAPLGRMVIVAIMGGDAEPMPLRHLMSKRLSVRGTMLRARPLEEKITATRLFDEQVNPLLADGHVRPIVDKVYALDQVAEAHRYLEANESFGKVILSLD